MAGPERFELPTSCFEDRHSSPTELRTDFGSSSRTRTYDLFRMKEVH